MSQDILIVQPNKQTAMELKEIFESLGNRVKIFSSIEHINTETYQQCNVYVIDIVIWGQNWIESYKIFTSLHPNISIILISSDSQSLSQDDLIDYRQMNVTRKPFASHHLELALLGVSSKTRNISEPTKMMASEKVQIPIRTKITFPYIFLALLLAFATAFIVTRLVVDSLAERFANQLVESGKILSEWMVKEEDRLLETVRLIANQEGIDELISQRDAESLREMIYPITVNSLEEAVEILEINGSSLISLRHKEGGNIEEYDFIRDDQIFAQWEIVKKIINGEVDSHGDKYADILRAPWGDYFYIAGPIYNQEKELVGIVLVGKSLREITTQMRKISLAQVTIYDFNGKPIATTLLDEQILDPTTAQTILDEQDNESLRRDINISGIDYSELINAFEARYDVDFGLIGVALPQNFFVQISNTSRMEITIIATVVLLVVIIIGLLISNSITRPLMQVVKATAEVARGNLNFKLETDSNDETRILARTFNHMVSELESSHLELLDAYESGLEGWARALELRDYETDEHSKRVVAQTVLMAERFGIKDDEDLKNIRYGALLHDIGKMGIPDNIMLKPGKLTNVEWEIMKKHPVYAYEMLKEIKYLREAIDIPYCHHEKWDGSGYPNGMKGDAIPLAARIFSVVDVYDALTSDRPYRKAWPSEKALDYIMSEKNIQFDPLVVDTFLELMGERIEISFDTAIENMSMKLS